MSRRFLKPALEAFSPYSPGEQPPDGEGWVKLNTNESPWPPSPRVLEAVRAAVNVDLRLYPSPGADSARAAIAAATGVEPTMVLLGNGGDEVIAMAIRAFCAAGQRVAFPWPTYPLYEPAVRIQEGVPSPHEMKPGGALPASFLDDPAPLKFLCNPNSPTGSWLPRAAVEEVVASARGVVVLDEAYVDFAPEERTDLLAGHDNLLIVRTFSKSGALAGMRLGYGLAQESLINQLAIVKESYNIDRLAMVAATAAARDVEYRQALVEHVLDERALLSAHLGALGFEVLPSAANFVFARPPAAHSAGSLHAALRERRILVRHYDRPPVDGWFRVTVGTREQHDALIRALEEITA